MAIKSCTMYGRIPCEIDCSSIVFETYKHASKDAFCDSFVRVTLDTSFAFSVDWSVYTSIDTCTRPFLCGTMILLEMICLDCYVLTVVVEPCVGRRRHRPLYLNSVVRCTYTSILVPVVRALHNHCCPNFSVAWLVWRTCGMNSTVCRKSCAGMETTSGT